MVEDELIVSTFHLCFICISCSPSLLSYFRYLWRAPVVQSFDELWRAAFKRGDTGLKFAAPTARPGRTGPSNRADEARTAVAARECG